VEQTHLRGRLLGIQAKLEVLHYVEMSKMNY